MPLLHINIIERKMIPMVNCGGFHINKTKLKIMKNALTKQESADVKNKSLAGCGGLIIDEDVFKIDNKTHSLTMKEAESVTETIFAPCGGLKLDSEYFEVDKNGIVTLKEIEVDMMKTSISTTKVTFESLDDFTIEVKDEKGKIINPIEDKIYLLERTKTYTYKAISSNDEISEKQITTTSRQANLTKTIEF